LLERHLGFGFFWDGEQVPKRRDVVLPELDVSSRPHFSIRDYLQGCIFNYSSLPWSTEDWKREIDWAAKHKINRMYFLGSEPFMPPVAFKRTMAAFGVDLGPLTEAEQARVEFCQEIINYARSLGMEIINPGYTGSVPAAFRDAYPNAHYVEVRWLDFPPSYILYPDDPLFKEVGIRFIHEYNALFGTSHLYVAEPYGETRPGATEEEQNAIKTGFARVMGEMIAEADPEGTWLCSTWTFRDKEFWPKETVRAYMQAVPNDRFLVGDLWCEERPLYQELEYFWGRRWGFGVLHSFGGNTNLHGDIPALIRRAQEVATDPRASRCEAFEIMPEVVHWNHLYYDLCTRLAWDPGPVELDQFLRDYARRRYGQEHADRMYPCLRALADSVYSRQDLIPPLYQVRPRTDWALRGLPERLRILPGMRQALDAALACADALGDSPLYRRDLVDIAKEYLALIYGQHFLWLLEAEAAGDAERLQKESHVLLALLDDVERILASDPACHLAPLIERAERVRGAADTARYVREAFSTLGSFEELLDYARRDYYEMVRHYYRPRLEAYLAAAKKALSEGRRGVEDTEVDAQAREMARRWIEEGYPDEPIPRCDSIAVIRESAARWPLTPEERRLADEKLRIARAAKEAEGPQHRPWDTADNEKA